MAGAAYLTGDLSAPALPYFQEHLIGIHGDLCDSRVADDLGICSEPPFLAIH
jgi:hypothetical protein